MLQTLKPLKASCKNIWRGAKAFNHHLRPTLGLPLDDGLQFSISSLAVLVAYVQREVFRMQTAVAPDSHCYRK